MRADAQTQAWLTFGASVFILMGLNLAADAEVHAESAARWPGAPGGRAGLTKAYRWAGIFFALLAAALPLFYRGRIIHLERSARLGVGTISGLFALYLLMGKSAVAPSRRIAVWAVRLLILDLVVFAYYLLSR